MNMPGFTAEASLYLGMTGHREPSDGRALTQVEREGRIEPQGAGGFTGCYFACRLLGIIHSDCVELCLPYLVTPFS